MRCPRLPVALAALLLAAGCRNAARPGDWDEATVEEKLKASMQLESIDLSPVDGGFEGTGTYPDGETTAITVTQSGKRLDYTGRGDRGSNQDGEFVVD